jgi:hypothetical protein
MVDLGQRRVENPSQVFGLLMQDGSLHLQL